MRFRLNGQKSRGEVHWENKNIREREESQPYDQKWSVEENLATKETRKVTNSDQELSYKQKDVEQAFITSEKKKKLS